MAPHPDVSTSFGQDRGTADVVDTPERKSPQLRLIQFHFTTPNRGRTAVFSPEIDGSPLGFSTK